MEKTQFTSVQFSKGIMEIYDFGSIKLHAFKTNDLISVSLSKNFDVKL